MVLRFLKPMILALLSSVLLYCCATGQDMRLIAGVLTTLVIISWLIELVPLPFTALMIPVLAVLTGILNVDQAFGAFGNQILFLFIGAFFLARSMQKHGWDVRIATYVLASPFGSRSVHHLVFLVACVCWLFSMWISNTAACAMMAPLCIGIARALEGQFADQSTYNRFLIRLLLTCSMSASIGGIVTPVGSPPNVLALQFLEQYDIQVTFADWVLTGLPLSVCLLVISYILLARLFAIPPVELRGVRQHFSERRQALGRTTGAELLTAFAFLVAVLLWIVPDLGGYIVSAELAAELRARLPMGGVAILASALLFVYPVYSADGDRRPCLTWEDASQIDWGTIMLFGGGLCLGLVLIDTGLAALIGNWIMSLAAGFSPLTFLLLILVAVLFSEIGSNTASASIVVPIVLATGIASDPAIAIAFVVGVAIAASLGFMLPISTPPNAIIFGTGAVPLRAMVVSGLLLDCLGVALLFLFLGI